MIYYFRMSDTAETLLQDWINSGLQKPGKTNTELANLLGIPQSRVSEMRRGQRRIKSTELPIIAAYIEEPVPPVVDAVASFAEKLRRQRELAENLAEARVAAVRAAAIARRTGVPASAPRQPPPQTMDVPLVSWVSAGKMSFPDISEEVVGHVQQGGLDPDGDWIALRVVGDSMDRISPPDSIIFVDRGDKVLVPNACYVISNGDGEATYKRFRSNPMRFEPVSTNTAHEPIYPTREPLIVGRVKKSTIEM
ncbi:LexA SOS-response transcriptional repressors (RecA-mediated autopeptidases) [uncultured Caudovirales phage]|uniref:LexA SOS-response transcriptional repressors (RecA-mediated autopeptidases) n=1 Tax=uncultured Caudovirales phage TaxID=2100421 RepID=A0A6J7VQF0_9CAUD|nr:LexA SOS-response transcriptional repressors (RecA-mediated autopeptidases) [uncultured Caudovirales phage]